MPDLTEQAAGVVGSALWVRGREGGDELCEEVKVGFEGVSEHESVDLKERGSAVDFSLED